MPRSRPSPRTCPPLTSRPRSSSRSTGSRRRRDARRTVLAAAPGNPTALGVIGDARSSWATSPVPRAAYAALAAVADGSAARRRAPAAWRS